MARFKLDNVFYYGDCEVEKNRLILKVALCRPIFSIPFGRKARFAADTWNGLIFALTMSLSTVGQNNMSRKQKENRITSFRTGLILTMCPAWT